MAMSLFGKSASDYEQYKPTQYNAGPEYRSFNPSTYGGGMGTAYQDSVNQQLSGQLSPEQLQMLAQQFSKNLAQTRQGSYGMPVGAEKGMEGNLASQNALQALLMGQEQIRAGQSAAMPYLGMGQSENQYGQQYNQHENQVGQNFNAQENYRNYQSKMQAQLAADASGGGLFGDLLNAGTQWAMGGMPGLGQGKKSSMDKYYEYLMGQSGGQNLDELINFNVGGR